MKTMKIGEVDLLTIILDRGWTRGDLYSQLKDNILRSDTPKGLDTKYSKFYLKIIGSYDESLTEDCIECRRCPNNPNYAIYSDYNELEDDKDRVLVLESNKSLFNQYSVKASYYTNRMLARDASQNGKSLVVLSADKKTLWRKLVDWIKSFK